MFVKDRQEYIVKLVNKEGSARVKELSQKFEVTEDCIRKDLATLEKQGKLKRAYGGAVTIRKNVHKLRIKDRQDGPNDERKEIALKAVDLIHEGDLVFLDISTTSMEIASEIINKQLNVTVLTNMIDVLNVLSDAENVTLIFLGGTLNSERDGFSSTMTIQLVSSFKIDIAFMGVAGVNPYDGSLSIYTMDDGYMKERVLSVSKATYLLCEANKFEEDGNFNYATLNDVSGIISGKPLSEDLKKTLAEYELKLI